MNILLAGWSKSGNSLTYRIVTELLGDYKSYSEVSGLAAIERAHPERQTFPEEPGVTRIRWDGEHLLVGSTDPHIRDVPVDRDLVLGSSDVLWTHDDLLTVREGIGDWPDVTIYTVRDVRDVMVSYAHYLVTPQVKARAIKPRLHTARDVLEDMPRMERLVAGWTRNVRQSLLLVERPQLVVRFEEAVASRRETVVAIASAIHAQPEGQAVEDLVQGLSLKRAKARAPSHVRGGRSGDWREVLTPAHLGLVHRVAGETLEKLGYATGDEW